MEMMDSVKKLIEYHTEAEPSLVEIYLFPSTEEIHLVEVDENTCLIEGNQMEAWYLDPYLEGGISHPSGFALIHPQEVRVLIPPDGWGTWEDAELVWSRAVVHV